MKIRDLFKEMGANVILNTGRHKVLEWGNNTYILLNITKRLYEEDGSIPDDKVLSLYYRMDVGHFAAVRKLKNMDSYFDTEHSRIPKYMWFRGKDLLKEMSVDEVKLYFKLMVG